MGYNLISEKWIPVRRKDGSTELITPSQVTDNIRDNPIVAVDAARPDFNGALLQFFIGLLQTCLAPSSVIEWKRMLRQPLTPEELAAKLDAVKEHFNLDGDWPRFMQDRGKDVNNEKEIGDLLIDNPGDNAIKHNTDLFIKRSRIQQMCFACSASALFTLQLNAPSGGVGYRTSVRGGGPLASIILGTTLGETIISNLLPASELSQVSGNAELTEPGKTFPWIDEVITSENGREITPEEVFCKINESLSNQAV